MIEWCYVLIQIIEVLLGVWMIYSLYPEFRNDSKWLKVVWAIGCVVLCISYVWSEYDSFISNLSVLGIAIQFACIYCIFFEVKFLKLFLLEMLYLTSLSFLKLSVLILEGMKFDKTLIEVNRGNRTILECCWCIILIVGILFIMRRKQIFERYKEIIEYLLSERVGLLIVVTVSQWLLLSYNMWLGKQGFHTIDLVLNVSFIFCVFLSITYLLLRTAYHKIQADKNSLDISQSLLQEGITKIHGLYRQNREHLHEYYRTMEYLYCRIREKKYSEAEEFLRKRIGELNEERSQIWTGLPYLDFIINYKKQIMDQKEIRLRLELDVYEYPFEEADLGILLGNLLDNAIEACEKCVPGKREIYLHIWNVKYMFMLRMVNSSSKSPVVAKQQFITDKADKDAHGMGVKLVNRIVKRYGGNIDIQYNEEQFETKLIVPIMKEEEK